MIEILIAVLLLLAIFMMIFMMLLIYDDIADMIKAWKGVPCYIYHGLYGDWLCCGNCNGRIESDYKVCPNCHYRIIFGITTPNLKPENIQEKDES